MFKFSLGLIIGLFVSMIGFSFLAVFETKIDITILTNIVIAFATAIATAIHIDSQRKQHRERVWELNKDILLGLSSSLAKVIDDLRYALDYSFDCMQGIELETGITYEYPLELYQKFTERKFEVLNVYKTLMSSEVISAIEKLQKVDADLVKSYNNGELNEFEVNGNLLHAHEHLQKLLNDFVKKVSGIKYT